MKRETRKLLEFVAKREPEFVVRNRPEPVPAERTVLVVGQMRGGTSMVAGCLDALGVTPDEAIYVGDDWRVDICGASDAGMQPIWIRHSLSPRNYPDVQTSVPIITSLEPLLDLSSLLANR